MSRQLGPWWITISDSSAKYKTFIWQSLLGKTLPISTTGSSKLLQESYQRCFTVSHSLWTAYKSSSGTSVFSTDWTVIEFCWILKKKRKNFQKKNELFFPPWKQLKGIIFHSYLHLFLGPKPLPSPTGHFAWEIAFSVIDCVFPPCFGVILSCFQQLALQSMFTQSCRSDFSAEIFQVKWYDGIHLEVGLFSNQYSTNQTTNSLQSIHTYHYDENLQIFMYIVVKDSTIWSQLDIFTLLNNLKQQQKKSKKKKASFACTVPACLK